MNHGDHLFYWLAQKAGMTYGETLVNVSVEFQEANTLDAWGMEVWTRFEVESPELGRSTHYLPGSPTEIASRALRESTTIPVEW